MSVPFLVMPSRRFPRQDGRDLTLRSEAELKKLSSQAERQ
jgi:hypothetical protein